MNKLLIILCGCIILGSFFVPEKAGAQRIESEVETDLRTLPQEKQDKLLDFAEAQRALAIPHHVGYKRGWRGANFDHFRRTASPVVEIFSEHGCTESDLHRLR